MGRTKYSPGKRNEIVSSFVLATIDVINNEGVDQVSIRRVAARAGYSSATLYLYFEDLNELISLSSMFYLRNYVREIFETGAKDRSTEETYRYTWDAFCRHALNKPDIYLNLFFGPNSESLDEMVSEYYELFPGELEDIPAPLLDMLKAGNLFERTKTVLVPYAKELGLSEEETELANTITVAYFRSLLERASLQELTEEDKQTYTEEFLEGVFFILRTK